MTSIGHRALLLSAAVVVVLGGCRVGDNSQLEARRCVGDQDCQAGWHCEGGWCQAPSASDVVEVTADSAPEADLDAPAELDGAPDVEAEPGPGDVAELDLEPDVPLGCAFGATCGDSETCADGLCCLDAVCSSPMVPVAGQAFLMGCTTATDPDCRAAEQPAHEVTVPSFEMDVTEVSNAQYVRFLSAHGNVCGDNDCVDAGDPQLMLVDTGGTWQVTPGAESLPVVEVNWYGSSAYCAWAGKRLCSEAEWELAARGPNEHRYPWGDTAPTCDQARTSSCPYQLDAIGSHPLGVSDYGVYDLASNVREWIEDDWHATYDGAPTDGSPWIDEPRAVGRVIRGGDIESDALTARAAYRAYYHQLADGYALRGFRCCR